MMSAIHRPVWLAERPRRVIFPQGLLLPERVALNVPLTSRQDALLELARLAGQRKGPNVKVVVERLGRREARESTAIGHGAALPHADIPGLKVPLAVYLRPSRPIAFDAPDGKPVSDILAFLVPRPATAAHFEMLTGLAQVLGTQALRDELAACRDAASVCTLFSQWPAA